MNDRPEAPSTRPLVPSDPETRLRRDLGVFARAFADRWFDPIPVPAEGGRQLEQLAAAGEVVHVMRTAGILNFFYLAYVLLRRALPPLRTVSGLRWGFWSPFRRLHQEGGAASRLERAFAEGGSALVFLREPSGLVPRLEPADDFFFALVARARRDERPLYLVPELFHWEGRAKNVQPSFWDLFLGGPDERGMLSTALHFMLQHRNATMRIGRAIDLTAFVREHTTDDDALLVRKVRGALSQHLARETRALVGPPRKNRARVIEETLRDRTLRSSLERVAEERKIGVHELREQARRDLSQIAASYSPAFIAIAKPVLDFLFNRLHAGVVVDEAGLERALERGRTAPLVLCPSHKSHLDYLVMSWLFATRGVIAPLVAAGANLSFWPLGPLLRLGGAFFLRRTFKGDPVYQAAFRAYVKKLLLDGHTHEFFVEGGRSRTGKLLSPRLGMVGFELDAFLEGAQQEVFFVPVAIDYEKLLEAKSYAAELAGGEKRPESLRSLLTAPKVFAGHYGRIYVNFEQPISLRDFLAARQVPGDGAELAPEARRAATRALAQRITFGISAASTVTAASLLAAVLLAHRQRALVAAVAARRIEWLRRLAERHGARLAPAVAGAAPDPSQPGPFNEAVRFFLNDALLEARVVGAETFYGVPAEARASLAYYKNNLVHLAVAPSFLASALAGSPKEVAVEQVRDRVLTLMRLLKLEFSFPVGPRFDEVFDQTLDTLAREGLVARDGARLRPADPRAQEELAFLADLTRDTVESYRLLASVLPIAEAPVERKQLVREALERGRAEFLEGRLAFAEALSKPALENAIELFVSREVLVTDEARPGRVQLATAWRGPAQLRSLVGSIDELLGPAQPQT